MALPYACGCAIAGTAIRATSRPISPSGLNTVSGFFDQFARLRRWRRHCGRRERTSVRPLALGLAALNTHQTDKKAFVTRYVALLHTRFGRAMSLCSIRALGAAMCSLALCAYAARGPSPYPPPHWGGGIKSLRYSRIWAIGRRYGALRIDGLAVS